MRVAYDPQGTVVVPHITLLYPFVSRAAIPLVLPCLEEACTSTPCIPTTLAGFRFFGALAWLVPEPRERYVALHQALLRLRAGVR